MATPARIREKAAYKLGIVGEGETLPSYETEDLTEAYAEVYAELQVMELAPWAITANVPNQYSNAIAALVADQRARDYQIPTERYQMVKAEGWGFNNDGKAIKHLRELQARTKLGVTQIENF